MRKWTIYQMRLFSQSEDQLNGVIGLDVSQAIEIVKKAQAKRNRPWVI